MVAATKEESLLLPAAMCFVAITIWKSPALHTTILTFVKVLTLLSFHLLPSSSLTTFHPFQISHFLFSCLLHYCALILQPIYPNLPFFVFLSLCLLSSLFQYSFFNPFLYCPISTSLFPTLILSRGVKLHFKVEFILVTVGNLFWWLWEKKNKTNVTENHCLQVQVLLRELHHSKEKFKAKIPLRTMTRNSVWTFIFSRLDV